MRHAKAKTALMVLGVIVSLLAVPATVSAQEGGQPSLTLASANVQTDVGETITVTNTYELRIDSVGSGDQQLSAITGILWKVPDRTVGEITANVSGTSVSPKVTEYDRHSNISLPLQDVSAGETTTVTVSYTVSGPTGTVKIPLFVPDVATEGTEPVIDITVTLPEGEHLQGEMFPAVESANGNQVTAETLHMPGMITLDYGAGSTLNQETVLTIIGVLFIISVVGGWALIQRRRISRSGGDSIVD